MPEFKGIFAAILTPFDDNDKVDLAYLTDHIRFIDEGGVEGFVVCGTNGEAASLTMDERKAILEHCGKHKGRLPMVAGTGTTVLSETIELTKFARDAGADAVMVQPPYFFHWATEEGIIEYYKRVFDSASLPVFLYNIPSCAKITITHDIVRALKSYPHLAGVKDSSGNLKSTLNYIEAFPDLTIFVGDDHHVLAVLMAGGAGHITGLPNAFPQLTTALYAAFREGRDAAKEQHRVSTVRQIISHFPEFGVYKYVQSFRGFPLRRSRLPLTDLPDDRRPELEKLLRAHGLWDLIERRSK